MKLLIVRHAIAEGLIPGASDRDRPISEKGQKKFQQICKSLGHLSLRFDLLMDSPLLRSRQTADIFCKHFSVAKRETSANLDPFAEVSDLLLELKSYNVNQAAVVGHQPFLAEFISHCVTEDKRAFALLKRGGLAFLNFPLAVQAGSAVIEALLQPKFLLKKNDSV